MKTCSRYIFIATMAAVFVSCAGKKTDTTISENGLITYSPQIPEVKVITLEQKEFNMHILSNGKLSAASRAEVNFEGSGIITSLSIKSGQYVSRGETLAEIDSKSLSISLEAARISMDKADLDLMDVLAGQGYTAGDTTSIPAEMMKMAKIRSGWSSAHNTLKKAEHDMQATTIKAPISGRIANLAYGRYERSGSEPLCSIVDDSSFNVVFPVLESEYPHIHLGETVKIQPFSNGGVTASGHITSINPAVDKNGQISVTASVNRASEFIDGMNVRVTVEKMVGKGLVVPKSAVVIRDGLEVLFRYNAGKSEWVYVNTLESNADSYVVRANPDRYAELNEGDKIIVSGNLNLADGSEVKLVN